MYDPTIGRWISEDPVEFEAGDSNLFRYVKNNPVADTDPSCNLFPETDSWKASLREAMRRWEERLRSLMPPRFPPMTIHFPPRQFANVPVEIEHEICHQDVREELLTNESLQEKWWKPLKRDPARPPSDLPIHINVRFPQKLGDSVNINFAKEHPPGYDPKKVRCG